MFVMAALVCVLLLAVVALSYRLWKLRQAGRPRSCVTLPRSAATAGGTG